LKEKDIPSQNGSERIVATIPFNSKRKKATTAIVLPENENVVRVFVKGAPEIVLDLCNTYLGSNGSAEELSSYKKDDIMKSVIKEQFAVRAFRTLLIAYKDLSIEEFNDIKRNHNNFKEEKDREVLEQLGLTVIGIYGL